VVRFCLDSIREKVRELVMASENYELDILKLKPIDEAHKLNIPVYFLAGKNDRMVKASHTQALFKKCGSSDKHLEIFDGYNHTNI
jgi:esterase/lipase